MVKIPSTKSGIVGLVIIILISLTLISLANAVDFRQVYNPFTQKLDYYRSSNFSGYNFTVDNLFGNLSWIYLKDYPVECPAGSAITQLNDSVTCTSFGDASYEFGSNNFNGSGNMTANAFCIGNCSRIIYHNGTHLIIKG